MIVLDMLCLFLSSLSIGYAFSKPLTSKLNRILTVLLYAVPLVTINYLFNFSNLVEILIPDYNTRMNIKIIAVPICWILYFVFLFKDSIKRKLFVFIVMAVSNAVCEMVCAIAFSNIFDVVSSEVRDLGLKEKIVYYLISILGYATFSFFGYLICKKKKFNVPIPVIINFVAIVLINILILLTAINSYAHTNNTFSQFNLLVSPVLLFLLSISLYNVMKKLSDREILKEKLYWSENVKTLELEYYNNLQQKTNEVRKIRHDFKDNIETINLLISENTDESIEKAKEMLASLNDNIRSSTISVYADNVVVNAVVGAKVEEASKENIQIDVKIDLPRELGLESIDLNCVFLNLLNNAIESCKKLPENTERKIVLKSAIQAEYLLIKTENPFVEINVDNKGKIKTTKTDEENHGFGMTLINDIAQKYNGTFETTAENNKFTAVVSLKV